MVGLFINFVILHVLIMNLLGPIEPYKALKALRALEAWDLSRTWPGPVSWALKGPD